MMPNWQLYHDTDNNADIDMYSAKMATIILLKQFYHYLCSFHSVLHLLDLASKFLSF